MDQGFQTHHFADFQNENDIFDNHADFDQALMADVNTDMMYNEFQDSTNNNDGSQQQGGNEGAQKRTRASGEVLALLVNEFNKNANPNAQTRKRISEQTGMPERSVRIWFQNRRAKSRKMEKLQANEKEDPYTFGVGSYVSSTTRYDNIPLTLNNNYFFIDAKSLTVGSWKRIKSGNLSNDNVFSVKNLSNLSPFSINEIMSNSTDLMIVISRKNFEINYFFSAITDTSKILFRIFYPISQVNNCSISISQDGDDTNSSLCELKLLLNKPPKFAVYFSQTMAQNVNQWSICDDFSEGHQVNDAFIGGSGLPHVFTGLEQSLKFMNSFILDYNSTNVSQQEFSLPQRFDSRSPTIINNYPNHQPPQQIQENNDNDIADFEFNSNPLLQQFVQDPNFSNDPNDAFENFIKEDQGTPSGPSFDLTGAENNIQN
ncbi:unnamed protein product [Wickerhamomyces anomalus]